MIYSPYKNLGICRKTIKYLSSQNVLMRMPNFTILTMFFTVTLFLILLVYSLYNDSSFNRVMHAVLVDVILNLVNIFLQVKESDSVVRKIHEFVPEGFRALALIFYYVYSFEKQDRILIYLTLLYAIPIVYRLVSWTRYSKVKFFGV